MPASTAIAAAADDAEPLVLDGIKLRTAGKDAEALQKFQQAYQVAHTPRIVAQIGTAEQALGRWVDAETHVTEALAAKSDPWIRKHRVPLEEALLTIQSHLGTLDIVGEPQGAEISVDGRPSGRLPLASPLRLVAGQVLLQVRAAGYFPATRTATVVAGQNSRETIVLQPNSATDLATPVSPGTPIATPQPTGVATGSPPSRTAAENTSTSTGSWHRPAGWAFAAGAGAGAIVGVVGLVVRNDKADKYNHLAATTMCGGSSAAMCADLKSSGDSARTAAIIGFSAAGAFAVTSAILFLTAPTNESPSSSSAALDSCALLPTARGISCKLRF